MIQLEIKAPIGREYDGQEYTIKCMDPGVTFAVELFTVEPISPWRERAIPYQIPEGSTAKLRVTRSDRAYTNTKTTIEGGTILCPVHPYSVATPGKCSADVAVYGPDEKRLTSATFHFFVDRECAPTSGEDMPVYVDSIQGLIEFVEQSADRAEKAAERAENAEGNGTPGENGITPHIGENGNWYIGDTDTGVSAQGDPGAPGEDGGHYTPIVTQPTKTTMRVEFEPSKADMPAVDPVTVELPEPDSSQNVNIDPTLTVAGSAADAKVAGDAIRNIDSHLFVDMFRPEYTEGNYTNNNGVALYNNATLTGGVWDCVVLDVTNNIGANLGIITYIDRNRPILFVDADVNIVDSVVHDTGNPNLKFQTSVTVPENATKLIINHYKANTSGGDVEVTGYKGVNFVSHDEFELGKESVMSLIRRNITPVIPVNNRVPVVDEDLAIYLDNMFMGISPQEAVMVSTNNAYHPLFDKKIALLTHENITGPASATIFLRFLDDTQYEVSKAICYDKATAKTGTKKVLFIGDSITENKSYLEPLKELSDAGEYKIEFLGTLGDEGLKNEGRGGWAAYNYATNDLSGMSTNKSNAFWDGSAFNFSYYMQQSGIDVPDYIFVNLGTNDMIRGISDTSDLDEIRSVITTSYETMVNSIRDYSTTIPIVLWLPPTRSLIGRNNHSAIDKCLRANEILIDKFDTTAYINNRVYLMPTHLFVNPYTDYPSFTKVIDGVEYTDGTEAIHPTASGGEKIARGIIRQMMYVDGLIQG